MWLVRVLDIARHHAARRVRAGWITQDSLNNRSWLASVAAVICNVYVELMACRNLVRGRVQSTRQRSASRRGHKRYGSQNACACCASWKVTARPRSSYCTSVSEASERSGLNSSGYRTQYSLGLLQLRCVKLQRCGQTSQQAGR